MIPASQTLVLNAFDVRSRGKAMGVYAGVSLVFLSLGPLIGGVATEVSWRLVFWINLPLAVVTLVMAVVARPDGRVARGQRLDWPGALTIVPGLTAGTSSERGRPSWIQRARPPSMMRRFSRPKSWKTHSA